MSFWRLGVRSISALDISVGINNCRFFPRFAQITPFTALLFAFQSRMLPSLGLLPGLLIELLGPIERHRRLFILHFLCTRPPWVCNGTTTSRRERAAPCEEDTRLTLREQRGRPRRKAFLSAPWSFGSFRPAKRTDALLWKYVQDPCPIAGCRSDYPDGEAACQSGADSRRRGRVLKGAVRKYDPEAEPEVDAEDAPLSQAA